jgi:acyl carrier protein
MNEMTSKTILMLRNYMRDPATRVAGTTTLAALEIDRLDLPMVVLDIEDAFDIHVGYDEDIDECVTVADLVASLGARREAKLAEHRIRASAPRVKRTWLSTDAAERR